MIRKKHYEMEFQPKAIKNGRPIKLDHEAETRFKRLAHGGLGSPRYRGGRLEVEINRPMVAFTAVDEKGRRRSEAIVPLRTVQTLKEQ